MKDDMNEKYNRLVTYNSELIPKPYRVLKTDAYYDTRKATIKYDQSKNN